MLKSFSVLYIGNYREKTIRSKLSRQYLQSLSCVFDMVSRNVTDNIATTKPPDDLERNLESKDIEDVDVVIHSYQPELFTRKEDVLNICIVNCSTTNVNNTNWVSKINQMDCCLTTSLCSKRCLINSGVSIPIFQFYNTEKPSPVCRKTFDKNRCIFYTDLYDTTHSNIISLLRSYYYAFNTKDDVVLLININNLDREEFKGIIQNIKQGTHIYPNMSQYPQIALTKGEDPHPLGDIAVTASRGDSDSLFVREALYNSTPCIAPNWSSFPELMYSAASKYFIEKKNIFRHPGRINTGWLVKGSLEPCFNFVDINSNVYSGKEMWFNVSTTHLSECLKNAYTQWKEDRLRKMRSCVHEHLATFNLNSIVNQKVLENIIKSTKMKALN